MRSKRRYDVGGFGNSRSLEFARGDVDEALERDEILRRGISPSDVSSDAINHVVVVQHRARDRTRALERFAECFHERRVMRQGSIRMPLGERRCDGLARECPRTHNTDEPPFYDERE